MYEMATGTLPFRGESSGVIFKTILDGTPTPAVRLNPDIPPKLEDIVNKCLEKDRNLRYQHASEIRTDLQRLKRDTESSRSAVLPAVETPRRKSWTVVAIAAAVLLAVLASAGYFVLRRTTGAIDSVAVLPLVNSNSNADLDYLADGITDGVINHLSRLPQLRVMSRSTAGWR